jgi:hypothetical protein
MSTLDRRLPFWFEFNQRKSFWSLSSTTSWDFLPMAASYKWEPFLSFLTYFMCIQIQHKNAYVKVDVSCEAIAFSGKYAPDWKVKYAKVLGRVSPIQML